MDCDACNDLLLDLAYDELDEVRAASVRRHLESCSSCKAALAQLRATRRTLAQLPTVDPPPVSDALRAALEAATAGARSPEPALPIAPEEPVSTGPDDAEHLAPILRLDAAPRRSLAVQEMVRRAGALAMRRQVAMAAVFLLMLGFGVRYLPAQRAHPVTSLDAPIPEVIPATELPREITAEAPQGAIDGRRPLPRLQSPQSPSARPQGPMNALGPMAQNTRARSSAVPMDNLAAGSSGRARSHPSPTAVANMERANTWTQNAAGPAQADQAAPGNTAYAAGARPAETPVVAQVPAEAEAAPDRSWQALEREAEHHRAEGRTIQAVESLRAALAQDPPPPPAARRALARALAADLQRAGQLREAAEVRAQHLTPASDSTGLAGSVPSVGHATTASPAPSAPAPSTARPTLSRPARRSVNMQNELNSQSAY